MPGPENISRADVMNGNGPYGRIEAATRRAMQGARPAPAPEGGMVPLIAAAEHGEPVHHTKRVVHQEGVRRTSDHDTANGVGTLTPYDAKRARDREVLKDPGSPSGLWREPLPDID